MIALNEQILNEISSYQDHQFCIYSPDFSFQFYIKRRDVNRFSITMHRNNTKMFLRYVSYLHELQKLYESMTDVEMPLWKKKLSKDDNQIIT